MLTGSTPNPGASNNPPVTDTTNSAGDTSPTDTDQRTEAAAAAATTTATASATGEPARPGSTGSAATAVNTLVNNPRTTPARAPNRASQSRTVEAATPNPAAIGRNPRPAAFNPIAVQITAAASPLRTSKSTGNNTCVRPHPEHLARRGRTRLRRRPSRTTRSRA